MSKSDKTDNTSTLGVEAPAEDDRSASAVEIQVSSHITQEGLDQKAVDISKKGEGDLLRRDRSSLLRAAAVAARSRIHHQATVNNDDDDGIYDTNNKVPKGSNSPSTNSANACKIKPGKAGTYRACNSPISPMTSQFSLAAADYKSNYPSVAMKRGQCQINRASAGGPTRCWQTTDSTRLKESQIKSANRQHPLGNLPPATPSSKAKPRLVFCINIHQGSYVSKGQSLHYDRKKSQPVHQHRKPVKPTINRAKTAVSITRALRSLDKSVQQEGDHILQSAVTKVAATYGLSRNKLLATWERQFGPNSERLKPCQKHTNNTSHPSAVCKPVTPNLTSTYILPKHGHGLEHAKTEINAF